MYFCTSPPVTRDGHLGAEGQLIVDAFQTELETVFKLKCNREEFFGYIGGEAELQGTIELARLLTMIAGRG